MIATLPLTLCLIGCARSTCGDQNSFFSTCRVAVDTGGFYDITYLDNYGHPNTFVYFADQTSTGVLEVCDCVQILSADKTRPPEDFPPDCSGARPSIAKLSPSPETLVDVAILGVSDPEGDFLHLHTDSLMQDEPTGGLFEGDLTPDGSLNFRANSLRAERDLAGNGRVYTIFFTADTFRGFCRGSVKVCAPVVEGGDCVDDGPNFDSTRVPEIDLAVAMTDSPDPMTSGNNLTYTLIATNNDSLLATNVELNLELPEFSQFVSASPDCHQPFSFRVSCLFNSVPSRGNRTATVVVTPLTTGLFSASATVSSSDSKDLNNGNDQATTTTTINPPTGTDLAVTMTDVPDPVTRGSAVTYTTTVTNNGPVTASDVVLTDLLPPLEINSSDILVSQGSFSRSTRSNTITCNFGMVTSGASATLTVTGFTATTGTITNTASVRAAEPDPNTANNFASEDTTVNSPLSMILFEPWLDESPLGSPCRLPADRSARFEQLGDASRTPCLANLFRSWRRGSQPNRLWFST